MKHGEIPRDSLSGVVGLILAAGASTRMRPLGNKLTQLIDDERRLVSVPIDAMHEAGIDLVFVVLGSDAESLRAFLRDRPLSYVFNPEWEMGLGSSIAAGVRGILELHRPKAIMVCLGDLPGLRAEWLALLVEHFDAANTSDCICVPTHDGRFGHPVLFGSAYFEALAKLAGDHGGRSILEAHAEQIREVEITSDAILRDIDTPEDLDAWRRS